MDSYIPSTKLIIRMYCIYVLLYNLQEGDKRVLTISQKKFCADGKIDGKLQIYRLYNCNNVMHVIHVYGMT